MSPLEPGSVSVPPTACSSAATRAPTRSPTSPPARPRARHAAGAPEPSGLMSPAQGSAVAAAAPPPLPDLGTPSAARFCSFRSQTKKNKSATDQKEKNVAVRAAWAEDCQLTAVLNFRRRRWYYRGSRTTSCCGVAKEKGTAQHTERKWIAWAVSVGNKGAAEAGRLYGLAQRAEPSEDTLAR